MEVEQRTTMTMMIIFNTITIPLPRVEEDLIDTLAANQWRGVGGGDGFGLFETSIIVQLLAESNRI